MSRRTDRARAKAEEAEQRLREWRAEADRLAAALSQAEEGVGTAALESGAEEAARHVADLREQESTARAAVTAAEAAWREARRDALMSEAADLEREADRIDKDAEKHEARTRELLDALREHEGCEYAPTAKRSDTGMIHVLPRGVRTEQLRGQARSARVKADKLVQRAKGIGDGKPQHAEDRVDRLSEPVAA